LVKRSEKFARYGLSFDGTFTSLFMLHPTSILVPIIKIILYYEEKIGK